MLHLPGVTRYGHAGFLEWLRIGDDSEEILVLEPGRFLADQDSVAVVGYTKSLVKPTGRVCETDFVHMITMRQEKITRFHLTHTLPVRHFARHSPLSCECYTSLADHPFTSAYKGHCNDFKNMARLHYSD